MRPRVLIVPLLLLVGCGSDDAASDRINRAAQATIDAGGARVAIRGVLPLGERVYRTIGKGVMDARGSTDVRYTASVMRGKPNAGAGEEQRTIVVDGVWYLRLSGSEAKPWKTFGATGDAEFYWTDLFVSLGDRDALERLVAAGHVRDAGPDRLRGIPTERYEFVIRNRDVPKLAPRDQVAPTWDSFMRGVRTAPKAELRTELWIDRRGLLRRIYQLLMSVPAKGPRQEQTTDYFDFGPQRRIEPPPPRETELLKPDN